MYLLLRQIIMMYPMLGTPNDAFCRLAFKMMRLEMLTFM